MASPLFQSLVTLAAPYVGKEKAEGAITRRLTTAQISPDVFSKADLQKIVNPICDVLGLYLEDEAKRNKLTDSIRKMAL